MKIRRNARVGYPSGDPETVILPSLKEASTDRRLKGAPLRVLVYLHGEIDPGEYRPLKQSRVALMIGMDRGDVSRAFKKLVTTGYIREGPPQEHGQRCYLLLATRGPSIKRSA